MAGRKLGTRSRRKGEEKGTCFSALAPIKNIISTPRNNFALHIDARREASREKSGGEGRPQKKKKTGTGRRRGGCIITS